MGPHNVRSFIPYLCKVSHVWRPRLKTLPSLIWVSTHYYSQWKCNQLYHSWCVCVYVWFNPVISIKDSKLVQKTFTWDKLSTNMWGSSFYHTSFPSIAVMGPNSNRWMSSLSHVECQHNRCELGLPNIVHEQCATNLTGCICGYYLHASRMSMCTGSHIHWITTLQHKCFVTCLILEKHCNNCHW